MKFVYQLKDGHEINDVLEICSISKYYEAACTAELVQDQFFPDMSDELALTFGYEVQRLMEKCDDGELKTDTIANVLSEFKDKATEWLREHKQTTKDYNDHFGVDLEEDNNVGVEDMAAWIYEHEQLAEDFERYFTQNPI